MVGEFLGLLHETLGHLPSLRALRRTTARSIAHTVEVHAHGADQAGRQRGHSSSVPLSMSEATSVMR